MTNQPCWKQLGKDRPTVTDVLPIVRFYYIAMGNTCGGALHIVLDDGNIEDRDVRWCIERARTSTDYAEPDEYGERLGMLLLCLSPTQRKKLYGDNGKYGWDAPELLGFDGCEVWW